MSDPLRNSSLGRFYYRTVQARLLPVIEHYRLSPDQLTLLGVGLALLVPCGFYIHPALGLICIAASGMADSLDGLLARKLARSSAWGAFFDSSLDRFADACYLVGFWMLCWPQPGRFAATLLIFSALLFTFAISYVKARAEALQLSCDCGLMERGTRVLYLLVWAFGLVVFTERRVMLLWGGLVLFNLLTLTTVVQRMWHVRLRLTTRCDVAGKRLD